MKSKHHSRHSHPYTLSSGFFSVLKRAFPVFHLGWMLFYSLVFATVIFAAMHGLDWLSSALITSTGFSALTSANFQVFLRAWQGYAVILLLLLSLGVVGAVVMNGVIFLSDDMLHQRQVHPGRIAKKSVRSIRLFLCREAIPTILYYYVFVLFFSISLLSVVPNPFEIPGYFRYLISKRILSLILYFAAFVLICIPLLRNPLLLHEILLKQERPAIARRRTRDYVRFHRRYLFREILLSVLVFCAALIVSAGIFLYFPLLIQTVFSFLPLAPRRILVLSASWIGLAILMLTVLLALWILPVKTCYLLHSMDHTSFPVQKRRTNHGIPVWVWLICLAGLLIVTTISYVQFNYLFPPAKNIEAVVHRLGGDLDTENTLEGMDLAMELGAPAMETDIQRTKDGEYVIFHDSTLKRLCGMNTSIHDMTLEEVRAVRLPSPDWNSRRIPLLSEVLDKAKGHVRLYLELKGSDADVRMAQDVARMVRERDMEDECVMISMNYNLINYISRRIPDIQCGYLYFFAYGSPSSLAGNILLAQSNAISMQRTRAIHSKGKRMYCWTVNSRKTAQNMVRQRVDGIISDRYDIISSVLNHMESRNDYERIMDVLLR